MLAFFFFLIGLAYAVHLQANLLVRFRQCRRHEMYRATSKCMEADVQGACSSNSLAVWLAFVVDSLAR